MGIKQYLFLVLCLLKCVLGELCPKQCDCDTDKNGLNRATCVDQHIISIDVGVPKAVQVYSLSRNGITELENYSFKEIGYTSLQFLILSYNLISWVGLNAFAGLDNLVYLDLSSNRLRYIPSDLLLDTPQLDTLDLSGNIFESLENQPLLIHKKLQVLNLNNCRIKALPRRLFTRLPNLKKMDLSENYMVYFSVEVIRPLTKLKWLVLRNDYLKCTQDFIAAETWIESHVIKYTKQCQKNVPKMLEKMVSVVVTNEDVDVNNVWNHIQEDNKNISVPVKVPKQRIPPAPLVFISGLMIGLAIGMVGTYIWLRNLCHVKLKCIRPPTPRRRQRMQRVADAHVRANLLWSTEMAPSTETPPSYRRELLLREARARFPENGVSSTVLFIPPETPPPPYSYYGS